MFIYATGLPFTAPSHIICRLRPYIRLDLSATFNIRKTEKYENGINLSIVNALARENDIMYKLKVYPEEGFFRYGRQSFMLRIIPSISYHHKF